MLYETFKLFKQSSLVGNELKTAIQEFEINTWLKDHDGIGYFSNYTGSGKTRIGCRIIERFFNRYDGRICILVPTKLIKKQWEKKLESYLDRVEVYVINTYTNLKNTILRSWDILIVDELHRICNDQSKYFSKAISMSKFNQFAGLTATLDENKIRFLAKFGIREAFNFSLQEGYALGLVPEYDILNIASELTEEEDEQYDYHNKNYNQTLQYFNAIAERDAFSLIFACTAITDKNGKPIYSGVTIDNVYQKKKNEDWIKLVSQYYNISGKEVILKANIWRSSMKGRNQVLDNSQNKLQQGLEIINYHLDKKTIIFTDSISTADFLENQVPHLKSIHSKLKDKVRDNLTESFSNGDYNQIVTVKAFNEGVDVPALELGINNYFTSSEISFSQRAGRIMRYDEVRPNKKVNFISQVTRKKNKIYQDEVQLKKAQKQFKEIKWINSIEEISWEK